MIPATVFLLSRSGLREDLPCAHRPEPAGLWGGQILDRGQVVGRKRRRGRPRKSSWDRPDRPDVGSDVA